ncbi:glycosyltransferase family 4 protein [Microbacterium sp. NPDC091313]
MRARRSKARGDSLHTRELIGEGSDHCVVFVSSSRSLWGAERSLMGLAREFLDLGQRVALIAPEGGLAEEWRSEKLGEIRPVPSEGILVRRWLRFSKALEYFASTDMAVLFDIQLAPVVALTRFRSLFKQRPRIFLDVHDSARRNPRRRVMLRLARWASGSVCVSDYIRQQLPAGSRSIVISRGMHESSQTVKHVAGTLALIGQIEPAKNVEFGIQAAARSQRVQRVVIRGDGSDPAYVARCRQLAESMLGDRLTWDGRVEPSAVFDDISALLFMNDDEPSGRVVAEAQINGVIPIVPRAGGAIEFVRHGQTGWVYEPGDVASASAAIDDLMTSSELERIRDTAGRHARTSYNPVMRATDYLNFLKGSLAG